MRRIVAINGRPKKNGSMSGILIRELEMISEAKFDVFYAIDFKFSCKMVDILQCPGLGSWPQPSSPLLL